MLYFVLIEKFESFGMGLRYILNIKYIWNTLS